MMYLIAGGGIVLAAISFALNKRSSEKFEYAFFSKPALYISLAASAFLVGGLVSIPANHSQIGFTLVASVISILIAASIVLWLVYINCIATTIGFGLAGSVIQVPILMTISIIAIPILLIGGLIWLFGGAGRATPAEPKPFHQQQSEWYFNRMNPNGFHKKH